MSETERELTATAYAALKIVRGLLDNVNKEKMLGEVRLALCQAEDRGRKSAEAVQGETREEVVRVGREMRTWQKRYFKTMRYTGEKQTALRQSKELEAKFDALVRDPCEVQASIFEEAGE